MRFYENWSLKKKKLMIPKIQFKIMKIQFKFNEWSEFSSRHKNYFSETDGLIRQLSSDINPYDVFALFVDD